MSGARSRTAGCCSMRTGSRPLGQASRQPRMPTRASTCTVPDSLPDSSICTATAAAGIRTTTGARSSPPPWCRTASAARRDPSSAWSRTRCPTCASACPRSPGSRRVDPLVLGTHLEGPFLAPDRRGAHNIEYLHLPDPTIVDGLLEAARRHPAADHDRPRAARCARSDLLPRRRGRHSRRRTHRCGRRHRTSRVRRRCAHPDPRLQCHARYPSSRARVRSSQRSRTIGSRWNSCSTASTCTPMSPASPSTARPAASP